MVLVAFKLQVSDTLIARSAFSLTNGELPIHCMPIRFTAFRLQKQQRGLLHNVRKTCNLKKVQF